MDAPINDLVMHVLVHYKKVLDGMTAYPRWEYDFRSLSDWDEGHLRNLDETISAIRDVPKDWLSATQESYLLKHGRTLCRAFANYVSDLKKELGEEWKEANARLKEEFLKRGLQWIEPPPKRVDIEPNLERQLRAEIELVSKLKQEFCAPYMRTLPRTPSGEVDYVKWQKEALEEWKARHGLEPEIGLKPGQPPGAR